MIVLGTDPGLRVVGYGIVEKIEKREEKSFVLKEYGCIETSKEEVFNLRLVSIYTQISNLIKTKKPNILAIENIFFSKNKKNAILIGQVMGVILLAAAVAGIETYHYTPLEIKQVLTKFGKATKQQVKYMVTSILGLEDLPGPTHSTDALAVAICHLLKPELNTTRSLDQQIGQTVLPVHQVELDVFLF